MLKYLSSAWDSAYKYFLVVPPWVLALRFVQVHLCGERRRYVLINKEALSTRELASELWQI